MENDPITLRQTAVLASAVVYWAGVLINAYRVRKNIGRSPNLRPKTIREKLLWVSWALIITGWAGQPFLVDRFRDTALFSLSGPAMHDSGLALGIVLMTSGYAGTLLCYRALGDSWRIGVNRKERTSLVLSGPYRFVRHPIYLFQMMILAGAAMLIPTLFSLILLVIHFISSSIKASDEETHMLKVYDAEYREYCTRTGRFFPKWLN